MPPTPGFLSKPLAHCHIQKEKQSGCRSTSFRWALLKGMTWIFSPGLDGGLNPTLPNSHEFFLCHWGHRFFGAHTGKQWSSGQSIRLHWSFKDLKDTRSKAIGGCGAARTSRGGWKIVIWLCELCASVVDKWGWASTNIQMHSVSNSCWLHGGTDKEGNYFHHRNAPNPMQKVLRFYLIWRVCFLASLPLESKNDFITWLSKRSPLNFCRTCFWVTDNPRGPMKGSEHIKDNLLTFGLDQSWGSLLKPTARICLNTLDFTDLWDEEDIPEDEGTTTVPDSCLKGPPAPPPLPPPPPLAPPLPSTSPSGATIQSHTLKLHWRELQTLAPLPRMTRFGSQTIWAGLEPVPLDTNRLEYLFKSKSNSSSFIVLSGRQVRATVRTNKLYFVLVKSLNQWESVHVVHRLTPIFINRITEMRIISPCPLFQQTQPSLSVLGMKRSNIITITLSSLPPPRLLPPAIYSMDSSVLDREDVQVQLRSCSCLQTFSCLFIWINILCCWVYPTPYNLKILLSSSLYRIPIWNSGFKH